MYQKILKKHPEYFDCGEAYYNELHEEIKINPQYIDKISKYFVKKDGVTKTIEQKLFYDVVINLDYSQISKVLDGNLCRFFILKNVTNPQVKDVVYDIVLGCVILEYGNDLIVLHNELSIYPTDIQEIIAMDYYINCSLFDGFLIDVKDILYIYLLTNFHLKNKNRSNVTDLILSVFERNHYEIERLRKVVLKKLCDDTLMEKIIFAFFDNNLNATKTSQSVFMHRNTINNKLELIRNQTSIDIQTFVGAVAMYALLKKR